jgi:hypothetical protein
MPIAVGDVLRDGRRRAVVSAVATRVERRGDVIEHVTEIATRGRHLARPANVVRMPEGDLSVVAQFIRYHVLVRVYGGDPDAWLAASTDESEIRFLRWVRVRLRHDPAMLDGIREMVGATAFWEAASG